MPGQSDFRITATILGSRKADAIGSEVLCLRLVCLLVLRRVLIAVRLFPTVWPSGFEHSVRTRCARAACIGLDPFERRRAVPLASVPSTCAFVACALRGLFMCRGSVVWILSSM